MGLTRNIIAAGLALLLPLAAAAQDNTGSTAAAAGDDTPAAGTPDAAGSAEGTATATGRSDTATTDTATTDTATTDTATTGGGAAPSAQAGAPAPSQSTGAAQTAAPASGQEESAESLQVYFASGSAEIGSAQMQALDQAARVYRAGNPFVMVLSGAADTVGDAGYNLDLSVRRAEAVAEGLVARGIPIARLQVLGRGNSELPVSTGDGVAERQNRVVDISWR